MWSVLKRGISTESAIVAVVLALLLTSCGTEVGNPIVKRPTTPRVVAQDTIEADLFDLTDGMFNADESDDGDEAIGAALGFSNTAPSALVDSSCSSSGTEAQASYSSDRVRDSLSGTQSYSVSVERAYSVFWKSPQGGLRCDAKNRIRKRRVLLKGASVERSGRFVRVIEALSPVAEGDYEAAQFVSEGSKKTEFDNTESVDGGLNVTSSVTWSKKRGSVIRTSLGESEDVSESTVSSEAPIKILRRFVTENGQLTRRFEVQSGTSKTVRPDGSEVVVEFKNLKFDSQTSCFATSGQIVGSLRPTPSTGDETVTFTIDFSKITQGRPSVEFSDGQSIKLSGTCAQ